jgi:YHS domain-containing protein
MKRWIRSAVAMLVTGYWALTVTPASAQEAPAVPSAPIKQVYCPVTPTEELDPEVYTDYKGTRVYFCCDRCRARFIRDPEKYGVRLVGTAGDEPQPDGPDHDAGAEHSHDAAEEPQPSEAGQEAGEHHHDEAAAEPMGAGEEHTHQHARNGGFIPWLGGFHPAATDFPIALLLAALVAELLFILRKRTLFDDAGRFCIWGAALTGVATATLGWCFAGFRLVDADRLLLIHRWMGTSAALFIVLVLVLSERARSAPRAQSRRLPLRPVRNRAAGPGHGIRRRRHGVGARPLLGAVNAIHSDGDTHEEPSLDLDGADPHRLHGFVH